LKKFLFPIITLIAVVGISFYFFFVMRPTTTDKQDQYAILNKDITLDWLGVGTPANVRNGTAQFNYQPYMRGTLRKGSIIKVGSLVDKKWREFSIEGITNIGNVKVISKTSIYTWGALAGEVKKDINLGEIGNIYDKAVGVVKVGSQCLTGNIAKGSSVSFSVHGWLDQSDLQMIGDLDALKQFLSISSLKQ